VPNACQPGPQIIAERRQPALFQVPRTKVCAKQEPRGGPVRIRIISLGQLLVEVWAILITDRTYTCSVFSREPVI
jgi:hypothetical protein